MQRHRIQWIGILTLVVFVTLFIPPSTIQYSHDTFEQIAAPLPNHPPDKPSVEGPRTGEAGQPYHYTACATDPDGDTLHYAFDWGDGCRCTVACCYASGEPCTACHVWESGGIYQVRACAMDAYYCWGDWSDPLRIVMPKTPASRCCHDGINYWNYLAINDTGD